MTTKNKAADAEAKSKTAPAPAKVEGRRVEVLSASLKSTYGTAARGARVNMTKADAEMFEADGRVRILGAL